jgi:aspartyl-tRNA(Asn)/glutamyl-tRNA(Gln) amidotransferase subunit A
MSIEKKSIATLATDLRSGRTSAAAIVEDALDRHARHGAALGAYKTIDPARVRRDAAVADKALKSGRAAGALHGIPVSVKDLYGVAGYPTFAGTPKALPKEWSREGPVVTALKRQMGIVAGKTHTVEFAFGGIGTNIHWKTPRNPWGGASYRIPGGSSSGAGVSLGEGSALVALGTDTGGSVRLPATFTGTVGLKITHGRWSLDGIVPLAPSMDTPGPLARTVLDTAYAFAALDPAGHDAMRFTADCARTDLRGVTLGICDSFMWDDLDPGVGEAARRALNEAERKGARLVKMTLPEFKEAYELHLKGSVLSVELKQFLDDALPAWKATLAPIIQRRVEDGANIPGVEYVRRLAFCRDKGTAAARRLDGVDAIVMPTSPLSPPRVDEVAGVDDYVRHNRKSFRFTCPVNLLGLCALSMPVGLDRAGLPVGLQLVSRPWNEERLLAVSAAIETAIGDGRARMGAPPLGQLPRGA